MSDLLNIYYKKILILGFLIFVIIGDNIGQRLDLSQVSLFEEFRYEIIKISPNGTWYIYLENGELLTSTDEGTTWAQHILPPNDILHGIYFFSDGAPFIIMDNGYYSWIDNQWAVLPDFSTNQSYLRKDDVITMYNDTIWHAQDSEVYISTDKGRRSELIMESDSLGRISTIKVSDNHIYLLGKTIDPNTQNLSYYQNVFYEKYNRSFALTEKMRPPSPNSTSTTPFFGHIEVTPSDSLFYTTIVNNTGADGEFHEYIFDLDITRRSHDFKIIGDKVYFTFYGNKLGVYNIMTGEVNTYDINGQGTIRYQDERIYVAEKNRLSDITDYETGQIEEIIPDLKRSYSNASQYQISSNNIIYAYTGYNLFWYNNQNSTWLQVDTNHDEIISFDLSPSGNLYALTNQNLYISKDNGISTDRKLHNSYHFNQAQTFTSGILRSIQVFNDDKIYLSGSGSGFSYLYKKISIDGGCNFYTDYNFGIDYPFKHLGDNSVYCNGNAIGEVVQGNFVASWDTSNPDLIGLPFGYELLPIDSSLIYLHPGNRSRSGFSMYTQDFGQSWVKTSFGPFGKLYKGSGYETSWVSSRDGRIFLRENLTDPFTEVDFSSLGGDGGILAESDGDTYYSYNQKLYKIGDVTYHPQRISGRLYIDNNDDCIFDTGEELISQAWTFTLTGPDYSLTTLSADGAYDFDVPIGDYQLEVFPPSSLWSVCSNIYDLSVTDPSQEIVQNIGVNTEEQCVRIEVGLSTPKVKRCNFTTYTLTAENTGVISSDEVIVEVTPDPFFELVNYNFSFPYEILANGNLRLNFGSLDVMERKTIQILYDVSCQSSLGQQHCMFAEAFSAGMCINAASTLFTEYQNNVGPFDPNDMRVFNSLGYRALNFEETDRQYYHVRFQNTGTDTAENVEVRVTLDDSLDIRTLQVLDGSHDYVSSLNDGQDLILRFDNIMLPDSNINEPASNGYFRYSIVPVTDVKVSQEFKSRAAIYFDYNLPIITNESIAQIGNPCGPPIVENINKAICSRENYEGYYREGYYEDYFTSVDGCDSIRKLNLVINDIDRTSLDEIILCPGEFYQGINTNTFLIDSLQNMFGCDSIISQRIYSVEWRDEIYREFSGCIGDTISGYYESGIYKDTVRRRDYCLITTTDLTITEVEYLNEKHELCYGESIGTISESGIYLDTLRTAEQCDSLIIERDVIILDEITSMIEINACDGDIIEGYVESGTYTDIITSASGCDSTRTIILKLHPYSESNEYVSICNGQNYLGYTESGIYIDTLISSYGCDSIRSIQLEINDTPIEYISAEICSNDEYEGYTNSGIYTDNYTSSDGCDSTRILDLMVRPTSVMNDTVYLCRWETYEDRIAPDIVEYYHTTDYGCDSIIQIELLLVDQSDPICALDYDSDPILMRETDFLNISPNPISDIFTLEIVKDRQIPSSLTLVDSNQRSVTTYNITEHKTSIDISELTQGVYIAVLNSGHNVYVQKIVKMN